MKIIDLLNIIMMLICYFNMENEIWKDILNYDGVYKISNLGRVKSFKHKKEKGMIMKGKLHRGYKLVTLSKDLYQRKYKVHRLVAHMFLGLDLEDKKKIINHKNHNKIDNRVDNLEIVSCRENTSYQKVNTSSKYVGVSWNKRIKKWNSYITINDKKINLGYYLIEKEAHNSYLKALIDYGIENKYADRIKK